MKSTGFILIAAAIALGLGNSAVAQGKPIQLALVNPIQIFDEQTSIAGLRFSLLYGKNTSVSGVDLGFVNFTTSGTSQGIELGFDEMYFLRAGVDYLPAQDGRRLATGISAGAGLRLKFAEFDYAFTPNDKSTCEDLHRFTITFLFGPQ